MISHIGTKKIYIPQNIKITIFKNEIKIEGPFGTLVQPIFISLLLSFQNNYCYIIPKLKTIKNNSLQGLLQKILTNMIIGVTQKFKKVLILEGIGYKFQINSNYLILSLGYTHVIKLEIPSDLELVLESPIRLIISGINKEKIGLFVSKIRKFHPPEPYKGKGILYEHEKIIRKIGKKLNK